MSHDPPFAHEPALRQALRDAVGAPLQRATSVSGGCIANATRLDTEAGPFFLKWGRNAVARTFAGEAAGLQALADPDTPLRIPNVYATQPETDDRPGFLLMEWIDTAPPPPTFDADLGEALAVLHHHTEEAYGFSVDNHIGRRPQPNSYHNDWPTFFRTQRLHPQVEHARANDRWPTDWDALLDRLLDRLPTHLPSKPPPSLVHGDLWSGNVMATAEGSPALIDPAVYYGHREVDLAMTDLFGGFDDAFMDAYRAAWPLSPGYELRASIYNLYHLINHLNHFGGAYAQQVRYTLQRVARA